MAVADLDADRHLDLVVFTVDNPAGQNAGYYRVGHDLAADGTITDEWGPWQAVPGWPFWENQDAGIAVADLDANGHLDLVVFTVDNPVGQNAGYYRVGHDLAADGTVTDEWGPWVAVPDWPFWENQGADVAIVDLVGDGGHDLVVVVVDAPPGQNIAYYRVGHRMAADGTVTGGWGPWVAVPDWPFWENQGVGATVADLDGDGRPELLVFTVDNPAGQNAGYYTVGWGLDASGRALDGWGPWTAVDGWRFWENQGAGAALADLSGTGRPELVVFTVDNPAQTNVGYYRVLDLVTDRDTAATLGVWRLLDFDTEVLAVHAALLHTGDVLLFSGSGNDPDRLAAHQFRTRVWRYPQARLDAPDTPIDLFCCGQAFLPDGGLLAAGGTEQYDPFRGLRDALVFDPATSTWGRRPDMTGGRWYPALVPLDDGTVVAVSGLGADGNLNLVPEVYAETPPAWAPVTSPGPWPTYAHLYLLADSRLFYAGGQYGSNNGVRPSTWDVSSGATAAVPGVTVPDMRNQSASILLPPAQDQRVMLMGGGGWDMHNEAPAVADVCLVDLAAANPAYRPVTPLHEARMHLCAVLLPDRTVLVNGGAAMEEAAMAAALDAEIFDPTTETWTLAARSRVPRLYHSIALLMPDGKVITAGSNPARKTEELRIEVYWPPYLFTGPRPSLVLATDQAVVGDTVTATTDDPALASVGLVRPGATTHSSDNEQRLVDVPTTYAADGALTLRLPAQRTLTPPGWYLVFAVSAARVPSHGTWLHLS